MPAITVPKGGGALRGIDQKFSANPATGTGSLTVPVATSPARQGAAPQLALTYNSGNGNGPFGLGWSLSMPAISRATDKGVPRYADGEESDTFVLSGMEDLVPLLELRDGEWIRHRDERVLDGEAVRVERYRPRVEGLFARIERCTNLTTAVVHWRAVSRDNVTTVYGARSDARLADPRDPARVFRWLICETFDDLGNATLYTYKAEDSASVDVSLPPERNRLAAEPTVANRYLKRVRYGNRSPHQSGENLTDRTDWMFEVVFDYGEHDESAPTPEEQRSWLVRQDPFSDCRAGFEIRTYRRCLRSLLFHHFHELGPDPTLVRSTDFGYAPSPIAAYLTSVTQTGYLRNEQDGGYLIIDPDTGEQVSPKSMPPLEFGYTEARIDETVHSPDADSLDHLFPAGRSQWVDLDGDGVAGMLSEQDGGWLYAASLGRPRGEALRFAPPRTLAAMPSIATLPVGQQLMDLAGDGTQDLVLLGEQLNGYYTRVDGTWEPFTPFPHVPEIAWDDPNLRLVDLTGDGQADLLRTEDDGLSWLASLSREGFAAAQSTMRGHDDERGPALVFADAEQSVHLADMNGDGLADLLRVRIGEVCYWPSMGYGRFGAKVTMDGAPVFDLPERFDQRRLRLADIDGSGTADIIYLGYEGAALYLNQSGNGWSEPRLLGSFPPTDDLSAVTVADITGAGTASLIWTSPLPGDAQSPLRYIDLMGSGKPHLLDRVTNNLGAQTQITYAPSTRFSLADKAAGRPWATTLPFPVHVVDRVELTEAVTGTTLVSSYGYHHGFYDGHERELHSFGMVERWDAESLARGEPAAGEPNGDETVDVPPVWTRSWFHTGAYLGRERISQQYAEEYYDSDANSVLLPDTVLPPGLSTDEEREACRALKGKLLRTEVYAADDTVDSDHPYTTTESSYSIRLLQPRDSGQHAVFLSHHRETLTHHYERRSADPRVTHGLTLEVDGFGNVTRSAAVGYPRRVPAFEEQAVTLATYTENTVVNQPDSDDGYRIGVPVQTRAFELTGLQPTGATPLSLADIAQAISEATEIPYEAVPGAGAQLRLVEWARTLYYDDALTASLPFGDVGTRALPFESYALAFTPGLLDDVVGDRVGDALLMEGGYVQLGDLDDEGHPGLWWSPSGRHVLDPARFFLQVAAIDPFGNVTRIGYDQHLLASVRTEDPVGNLVTADLDYRTLQPAQVTDPNGNRGAVRVDALGMVVATAVLGRDGAGEGDTLEDPTTRLEYHLHEWHERGQPAAVHTFARERHGTANPRWQQTVTYTDGLGRVVETKVQAEPGPAAAPDLDGAPELVHADPRWVGSGRVVYDNKGNPVKQYEPYFSDTHEYENRIWGVTPVLHYDPLGRLAHTDLPDGTVTLVEFDAWQQATWDRNDTVLGSDWFAQRQTLPADDPERRAAELAAEHAGTPTLAHLDTLGRAFLTLADLGGGHQIPTHVRLDIEGNPLVTTDARGNGVQTDVYDVLGRSMFTRMSDSGERHSIGDVTGGALRTWDDRGHTLATRYDQLRRPTHLSLQEGDSTGALLERIVYGEDHPDAGALGLRGQVLRHYDGAGVATNEEFDFKGNLRRSSRRLAREYRQTVDWFALDGPEGIDAIAAAAEPTLEAEPPWVAATEYDALNRPIRVTAPDGSVLLPSYNEANLLDSLDVHSAASVENGPTPFVTNIDYDAKGQRESIAYGNGVTTSYTYDEHTFRLAHLVTLRASEPLQDVAYTYDPVGNITTIIDAAQPTVFFDNTAVTGEARYEYDALYRLTRAEGRELAGLSADAQPGHTDPPIGSQHPNDLQALRNYTEDYAYDDVGNILRLVHRVGPDQRWIRRYRYAETSNRLDATSLAGDPDDQFSATYDHDEHGNITRMPHLPLMRWDERDRLRATSQQVVNSGTPGTTYYVYDAAGQRVRKVTDRQAPPNQPAPRDHERIYLGGFELHREYSGQSVTSELATLHVMDGTQRVALVETRTVTGTPVDAATAPLVRYQLGNHLGSVLLELDGTGNIVTHEEYHPYGTTSYHAAHTQVSAKRYRYTGKEKDPESGLYYHGARYYASWLGRWTAADPIGLGDGINRYTYAQDNPTGSRDSDGTQAQQVVVGSNVEKQIVADSQEIESQERQVAAAEKDLQRTGLDLKYKAMSVGTTSEEYRAEYKAYRNTEAGISYAKGQIAGLKRDLADLEEMAAVKARFRTTGNVVVGSAVIGWGVLAGGLLAVEYGTAAGVKYMFASDALAAKTAAIASSVAGGSILGRVAVNTFRVVAASFGVQTARRGNAPIKGKPQVTPTPGHDQKALARAKELSQHPGTREVHQNASIKRLSGGRVSRARRPDNTAVNDDGSFFLHEEVSPSDNLVARIGTNAQDKAIVNRTMKILLELGSAGEGVWITSSMPRQMRRFYQNLEKFFH